MSPDSQDPQIEIAHVLFMDLVGYSLLPMVDQSRYLADLQQVVRSSAEFRRAEACAELIRLPTGDGMALVFFRDPVAPVRCAMEVARALREHPHLSLRMGLHSGPIYRVEDINANVNVSGGGVNLAQRVMDSGDAGHILLSGVVRDLLHQVGAWPIHDLGEHQVKHGERVHLYSLYTDDFGNPELPKALKAAPATAAGHAAPAAATQLEAVGGAVPLDSRFYIVRPTDGEFRQAMDRRDCIVLLKGARQMGKTSLLARGLQQAREAGACIIRTDFQKLNAEHLRSPNDLFLVLAQWVADQLRLDVFPEDVWHPRRGPSVNFERFLSREVLDAATTPIVWGIDEVDRLFTCEFASEVFGLFRSWHNERALDPSGPWSRLTLAMAYATEAHLFISDMNQSPFNVGTRLTLQDFSFSEVSELNRRCGAPLRDDEEVKRFCRLVSGHPYLVRRGLHELASHSTALGELEAHADHDEGPFGDHLRRMLVLLAKDADLANVTRGILQGKPCPDPESFYRLRSSGVMAGETPREVHPRCQLYATYLERHLL